MGIPVFVGAGSGATGTGGSASVSKTSCTAGNLMVLQVLIPALQSSSISSASNVENLAGTDNAMTIAPATHWQVGNPAAGRQAAYFGRVMTDGTVSVDLTISSSADSLVRLYEFSGADSAATTAADLLDNSESGTEVTQQVGTSTSVFPNDLTTTGDDRLGLAFVAVMADLALDAFSGESGADWVESVAEFTSTSPTGAIGLQICDIASATTVSGGSDTIGSSSSWAVDVTSLIGATAATLPAIRVVTSLRW